LRTEILYGVHAVAEALSAGRRQVHEVWVAHGEAAGRLKALRAEAAGRGIAVQEVPSARLADIAGTGEHQGVAARASAFFVRSFEDLRAALPAQPEGLLLALDSLQDPHNLGAVLRTALCAGVDAVLIPRDRSALPTPSVSKVSAGALEHTDLILVTNLVRSLEQLKEHGFWVVGLERTSPQGLFEADLTMPVVLVIGGERSGMRPLVKRTCDLCVSIPQQGPLDSLNASAAAAVALYEIRRQRLSAGGRG
jgi:23S rRNA (guanosine2251-2'-O)-methyltransferase